MAKRKPVSKNEIRRREQAAGVRRLAEIKRIVGTFRQQAELDCMLLQQEDPQKRMVLFNFIKPFCKFPNPQFPTTLESQSELIAVKPQLVLPRQQVADNDERIIHV